VRRDYYPMPWPQLKYDTRLGGYRVGVTEQQLWGAPNIANTRIGIGRTEPTTSGSTTNYKTPL